MTIDEFALAHAISVAEAWARLQRGELIGRTVGGELRVYAEGAAVMDEDIAALPPLPVDGAAPRAGATGHDVGASPLALALQAGAGTAAGGSELALLLDHLSLAKEENREILRMTQESIRKVTELSDSLVEMKDAVIDAKETVILSLREQVETKDREIRRLRQQMEDLEMRARTIGAETRP